MAMWLHEKDILISDREISSRIHQISFTHRIDPYMRGEIKTVQITPNCICVEAIVDDGTKIIFDDRMEIEVIKHSILEFASVVNSLRDRQNQLAAKIIETMKEAAMSKEEVEHFEKVEKVIQKAYPQDTPEMERLALAAFRKKLASRKKS